MASERVSAQPARKAHSPWPWLWPRPTPSGPSTPPAAPFTAGPAFGPTPLFKVPAFTPRFPWIGGDLQTVRNNLVWKAPALPPPTRLALPLRDGSGDFLLGALHKTETAHKPLVILVHGLTGDEDSANIVTSAAWHLAHGHPVLRLNLRGAGPRQAAARTNASGGHYHAGRSADVRDAIAGLPRDLARDGVLIAGTSLGGNVVLKLLAEGCANFGSTRVIAGASISAPIDLKMAQLCIMKPRNALYQRHLLNAMREQASDQPLYRANAGRIRTIYDFDDLVVAPSGGFEGAEDYYRRSSSAPLLDDIRVPALLIHAADDPWVPAAMYRARAWRADPSKAGLSKAGGPSLLMPASGGHVGFHGADHPQPWHDRAIAAFFQSVL